MKDLMKAELFTEKLERFKRNEKPEVLLMIGETSDLI